MGHNLYELHEVVKVVGVDLLMGNSQATYSGDDEKIAFVRIGLAIREERSSGMVAGSILSIGSPPRFQIMWIQPERMALLGIGILAVLL